MPAWDGLNRRQFPRVKYPCLITIRKGEDQPDVILTHTENVGIGGVCVILKKNLQLFSDVEMEVDLLDTESHIKCKGKVVWSIQRKDDERKKPLFYDTGVEFQDLSAQDQKHIVSIINRLIQQQGHNPAFFD